MRRLSPYRQNIRGVPRQLRALKKWSDSFDNYFPDRNYLNDNLKYYNWKIPVSAGLVAGDKTKQSIQAQCAQRLIDACGYIIEAKPTWADNFRITATICLPDMFTSEVCIYLQEEYFQSHTSANKQKSDWGYCEKTRIADRSLAKEWKLSLSRNIQELGVRNKYVNNTNPEENWICDRWYFGEVF